MRIALLGGAGRLGSWLHPWLSDAHDVNILDRQAGDGVIAVQATDRAGLAMILQGHDALVHLAAVVPRGDQTQQAAVVETAWAVNVGSVAQAMLACADAGVTRFIHLSSLSVFTDAGQRPILADDRPDSLEPYGLTKRVAEALCSTLADELGLDAVSVRLGWPTSEEVAPLWVRPATGEAVEVRLASDGTVIPALGARALARLLESELARELTPGHRTAVWASPEALSGAGAGQAPSLSAKRA